MLSISLSSNQIKLIAIIAMVIDHIGAVFYPEVVILRIIGRLTMPIMAYFIAEGYHYTKNVKAYMLRLLIFGLITMYPYALYFENGPFNVMFSLLAGLMGIHFYDRAKTPLGRGLSIWIPMLIATVFQFDGQFVVVFLIYIFHLYRDNFKVAALQMFMLYVIVQMMVYYGAADAGNVSIHTFIQPFALLALLPLWKYNGEIGKPTLPKYAFYIFYPLHISLLLALKTLIQ